MTDNMVAKEYCSTIVIACLQEFFVAKCVTKQNNEDNANGNAKYGYTVTSLNSSIPFGAVTIAM